MATDELKRAGDEITLWSDSIGTAARELAKAESTVDHWKFKLKSAQGEHERAIERLVSMKRKDC